MNTIHILIADDDGQFREDLRQRLKCQQDIQVVDDEAENGAQAIALTRKHLPDIVLMDLTMRELDGVQALRHIRHDHPQIHVIMVSRRIKPIDVDAAMTAGASGYVAKRDIEDELVVAVKSVAQGNIYRSRSVGHKRNARLSQAGLITNREDKIQQLAEKDQVHSEEGTIRIVVVENDDISNRAICSSIVRDARFVAAGVNPDEDDEAAVLERVKREKPDIILLDIMWNKQPQGGWRFLRRLSMEDSHIPVIILSVRRDRADVGEAYRIGIAGYVPKRMWEQEGKEALWAVWTGGIFFSPSLGDKGFRQGPETRRLTLQEQEVFYRFVRDLSTNTIAVELGIGEDGVNSHKLHIRDKIGHQDGWKGCKKQAIKDPDLLCELTEMERRVFHLYVGETILPREIAAHMKLSEAAIGNLMRNIRRKLNCHPDGWKGIGREEGYIE